MISFVKKGKFSIDLVFEVFPAHVLYGKLRLNFSSLPPTSSIIIEFNDVENRTEKMYSYVKSYQTLQLHITRSKRDGELKISLVNPNINHVIYIGLYLCFHSYFRVVHMLCHDGWRSFFFKIRIKEGKGWGKEGGGYEKRGGGKLNIYRG